MREEGGALLGPAEGHVPGSKLTFKPNSLSLRVLLPSPVHLQPPEKSRAVSNPAAGDNGEEYACEAQVRSKSSLATVQANLESPPASEVTWYSPTLSYASRRHGKRFKARTGCVAIVSDIFTSDAVAAATRETPSCRSSSRFLFRQ